MKASTFALSLLFSSTALACAPLLGLTYCFDNLSSSDQDLARLSFREKVGQFGGDSQFLNSKSANGPKAEDYMYKCSVMGKPELAEVCDRKEMKCERKKFRSDVCMSNGQ